MVLKVDYFHHHDTILLHKSFTNHYHIPSTTIQCNHAMQVYFTKAGK